MVSPGPFSFVLPYTPQSAFPITGGTFTVPEGAVNYPIPPPQLPPGAIPLYAQSPAPVNVVPNGGILEPVFASPAVHPWPLAQMDGVNRPHGTPVPWPVPVPVPGNNDKDRASVRKRRRNGVPRVHTPYGVFFADDPALDDINSDEFEFSDSGDELDYLPLEDALHVPRIYHAPTHRAASPSRGILKKRRRAGTPRKSRSGIQRGRSRTRSRGRNQSKSRSLSRPRGLWDPSAGLIATDGEYNTNNLAPRPNTWRPGFDLHRSFFKRSKQKFPCWDNERSALKLDKTKMNAMLAYTSHKTYPVHNNLGRDLQQYPPYYMSGSRYFGYLDYMQLATTPPVGFLRIVHPSLPWYIDIQARHNPAGVTILDIFEGIHENLNTQIYSKDYYNIELDSENREVIAQAFSDRCQGIVDEIRCGIKRVDFLGPEVWFIGLELGKHGWWTMKTVRYTEIADRGV